MIEQEQKNLAKLEQERDALTKALNSAMASGKIEAESEDWYSMQSAIDDCTSSIYDAKKALVEYDNAIRQINWDAFDRTRDDVSNLIDETEFLVGLLKDKDITDDNDKISVYKKKTYDNYMEEIISKEEYLKYVRDYDAERKKIESEKEEVLDKIESQKELDNEYDEWVEAFKDYINIEELTRDIVVELIEKIEVNADGSINIHYRFNNPYSV